MEKEMRKSKLFITFSLAVMTSAFMLAGCGDSSDSNSSKSDNSPKATATANDDAGKEDAGNADAGKDDAGKEDDGNKTSDVTVTAQDTVFTFNGVDVELNSDADAAVAALGEAKDVSSQLSCHGEGDDKTYTYDGFILNTYPLDGKDMVLEIVINKEGIKTNKDIQIGDSVDAVKAAYGEGYDEIGMYYAYKVGDGKSIQFFIEDDKVSEIDYYYDV